MLHFLLISEDGSGAEVALKLAQEGNKVSFYIPKLTPNLKNLFKGFKNPSLITDFKSTQDTVDIALFTTVHNGELAERFKNNNIFVIGGGVIHDKLELNRAFGNKFVKFTEVNSPNTQEFETIEEGLKYLKANKDNGHAVKANGNSSTTLSLVSDNLDYISSVLRVNKKTFEEEGFIIQDKVEGIEISSEALFNGEKFVDGFYNHTIEKKRIGAGDVGVNGGCSGNIVWEGDKNSKLMKAIFGKLSNPLKELGYCGVIDMNCIVNEKTVYFLEFSTRLGWDAFQALAGMLNITLTELFWNTATKKNVPIVLKKGYNIAVRLTLPPYPIYNEEIASKLKGIYALNINKGADKHVWLSDVMKEDGKTVLAGIDGNIGCVTAGGSTIDMAAERVYRTISNIVNTPDINYRIDIADGVQEKIETLKKWGWI
jgi:phosphoribosylamine--glycine ligase